MFGGSYAVNFSSTNRPTGDTITQFENTLQIRFVSNSDDQVGTGFKVKWSPQDTGPTTTESVGKSVRSTVVVEQKASD